MKKSKILRLFLTELQTHILVLVELKTSSGFQGGKVCIKGNSTLLHMDGFSPDVTILTINTTKLKSKMKYS